MIDPMMIKREGVLHLGYSLYIWICLFYVFENYISSILIADLDGSGLIERPTTDDLYKRIFIYFLMILLMILIAHCVEKFLRSNLFFPLTNMLFSSAFIILFFPQIIFATGFLYGNKATIAAITFMTLRLLLFLDSIILLKKYFRGKKRNET